PPHLVTYPFVGLIGGAVAQSDQLSPPSVEIVLQLLLLGGESLIFLFSLTGGLLAYLVAQRAPSTYLPARDIGARCSEQLPFEGLGSSLLRGRSNRRAAVLGKARGDRDDAELLFDARALRLRIRRIGRRGGRSSERWLGVEVECEHGGLALTYHRSQPSL